MKRPGNSYLSKREQQIMEIVYEREPITSTEMTELLPGEPASSTVRTLLGILVHKGHLRQELVKGKYYYTPVMPRPSAGRAALSNVLRTFYRGSVSEVVATLISDQGATLSDEEFDELQQMIAKAKESGR